MSKFHYQCNTCRHYFFAGKMVPDPTGKKYERCPNCRSWNYYLTNLSVEESANGVYCVEYSPPYERKTLFCSTSSIDAQKVCNRMKNLKWDVFCNVLAASPMQESVLYLCNEPCLMNGFEPWGLD